MPQNNPAPTLILPPRYSDDSNALWRAAIALDWNIERLQSWCVPEEFSPQGAVAIYGESLWANFVAEQLKCQLFEPTLDWLANLPRQFTRRRVEFGTLKEARQKEFPIFLKPAGEKEFEARVYDSPDELPPDDDRQDIFTLRARFTSRASRESLIISSISVINGAILSA